VAETIPQQIARVRAELETRPERLIRHVQRVVVEALDLAARWDVDPERTELAVWGHDLFRAHAPEELLRLSHEAGLPMVPEDERSPVTLHGPLAAVVMRERFAVSDDEALAGVRDHTLGRPEMPMIAKIVLLADKFEERKRRRTPVMKEIRRLARRDLDLALLCWADWKWVEERTHGWESHPVHWTTREAWVRSHHEDAR
jgi:predicted HD superfamily hydrolase involved in NAD metabolism